MRECVTFDLDLYLQGCLSVILPISWIIFICGTNTTHEGIMCHISFLGQRSRSHRSFEFSYCWRKDCFWPSMNVSWDVCRWNCWGIHCWSCIYCLNVPCYEMRFNQIYLRYYISFKIWPWKGHIVGPTSYRLSSISFFVSRHSHSWDMAISKSDLENPRSRPGFRSKVKVIQVA